MSEKLKTPLTNKPVKASLEAIDSDAIAMRFCEEIRTLGLTQTELAKRTGISKVAVSNYSRGHRLPAIDVLIKIDEIGGDMRYILTGKRASQFSLAHTDVQRFVQAGEEAKRQAMINGEDLSQKSVFERAWIIYQALKAMAPASS